MEIKYLGHSSFRLRGKNAVVVTDPFDSSDVGLDFKKVSADMVTVSHQHADHNAISKIIGTSDREVSFVMDRPGEYEIMGVSVIGLHSWHDGKKGEERGENTIFLIQIDDVIVAHLGDLGHVLSDKEAERIGAVDVLLIPVGGKYTIGPKEAGVIIDQLSPSVVIPMHYKVKGMKPMFDELATVDEFLEKTGMEAARGDDKISLSKSSLPEEIEVVVLG